jgi:type II secretory pathway pseudopilin PulG
VRETLEVLSFGVTGALLYFAILIRYFSKTPPSFTVMNTKHTHNKRDYKHSGFTLVETAIAMGMVAVMISSFLVVFGPAIKGIDKSLSAKEADRLTDALEIELTVLRNSEKDSNILTNNLWGTSFEKAFWWIKAENGSTDHPVLIYQYKGDADAVRDDGTLEPLYNGQNQYNPNDPDPDTPVDDYIVQASVRRLNDTFHNAKIQEELYPGNLVGKVYYVKMTQLIYDSDGKMNLGEVGEIKELQHPNLDIISYPEYSEAVIPFRAEFYEVKPALWSYINGNAFDPSSLDRPVVIKNIAIMR